MSNKIIKSKLHAIIPVLFIVCLTFILNGCSKGDSKAFERPPALVTVSAAVSKDVPVYLDAVGTSVAREVVAIKPRVTGAITQIQFQDGANVKRGNALFVIDPRPYEAQLHSAEATLAQNEAALELAKIEWNRVEGLVNTKAISKQDFDTRKNAVEVATAQVQQSKAAIETAKLNLDYCYIKSPIDGRAGQRLVDIGNIVSDDDTLLTIQRMDPIYADFTIAENDLSSVQSNMKIGTLKVQVRLPDTNEEPRDGSLTFLDNAVQNGTGTVKLRATIPNADHKFWPGRFVNIRLVLNIQPDAILVPAVAPQMSAQGNFVYVIKPDQTAELRPVKLGQQQGELVVIQQGIQPGEKVVVAGQMGVVPGGKVRIDEGQAAETSKPGSSGGKS
ncbi:MAG TPA: efflux RND transporter periplasmic adaptor subunit [Acidobacteriota bacterium]|nr:efflux RND transporter periplasmic adaptor subunit [Acidobacteriota bacterium]